MGTIGEGNPLLVFNLNYSGGKNEMVITRQKTTRCTAVQLNYSLRKKSSTFYRESKSYMCRLMTVAKRDGENVKIAT